jgi:ubiquinone/menaquinone biosynthesis C-methylase UbiE
MVEKADPVADYTGYDYEEKFWKNRRRYEDAADRLAIQRLLPAGRGVFVDVAGGYGRLADEYLSLGYKEVYVFDYSSTLLQQARKKWGRKIKTKQGDIYNLPWRDASVDTLMMVRATHHFADLDRVIGELSRVLKPGGTAVIEVANKRTIAKMLRYALKRDATQNPFTLETISLTDINKKGFFNYHPKYVEALFRQHGLRVAKVLSVSNLRSPTLSRLMRTQPRVALEKPLQYLLAPLRFGPSIYYRLEKK